MQESQIRFIEQQLAEAAKRFELVLVPGLKDSGTEHWQSCWQRQFPAWHRVTQRNWNVPDIDGWGDAIKRTLAACQRPAILIGHSLGALASCALLASEPVAVAGLMLVAPAEPAKFELDDRVPDTRLPVPSVVVASHDDPLMRFDRAEYWANAWGSRLIDLGDAQHINAEAGFGPWPYGLSILAEFVSALPAGRD
ncbi:RBBP9/YdeN family alpha/beta hydrolase [Silvimonas soli]|uniref:RBBP9/YdeN family alpha/beta hydrolase n=1 Tax=Silvimonas soli TaxID=2980100 RepID=UPI0024B32DEE|nr:alpha/beta hydrolase [Silvimonas soli]